MFCERHRRGIGTLVGLTLTSVHKFSGTETPDEIEFFADDGRRFRLYQNDDNAKVWVEDIVGSFNDLIGSPIILAEERSNTLGGTDTLADPFSQTWTFYEIATLHGSVTIRWCGEGNGYYSERVDFAELLPDDGSNHLEFSGPRKAPMDFSDALRMIKNGKRVTRQGWTGANMFVFLVPGSTFTVNRPPLLGIYPEGTQVDYRPHIDVRDAKGMVGPWTPSGVDLMADDWQEVT